MAYVIDAAAHQALDRGNGIEGIADRSKLCGFAHLRRTRGMVAHHGRQQVPAAGIRQGVGHTAAHAGDQRVGRPQVDARREPVLVRYR